MARIRTIKPEFWEDEKIAKLPIPCRLLYIGTWTFADDFGCIKGSAALLKSEIFPYDENMRVSEVKKWIDALVEARMLIPIIHNEESYYYIRTFRSHQVIDSRYSKSYIGKEIVNNLINNALRQHDVNTTSTRREDAAGNGSGNGSGSGEECILPPYIPPQENSPKSNFEKFNDWLKENCPNVCKLQSQINEEEFTKLREKYNSKQVCEMLLKMENWKPLLSKNRSVYLTFVNWSKRDKNG